MTVDIIVIFLACSFVDVLVEVVVSMRVSSCAPLLGSSGWYALACGNLVPLLRSPISVSGLDELRLCGSCGSCELAVFSLSILDTRSQTYVR